MIRKTYYRRAGGLRSWVSWACSGFRSEGKATSSRHLDSRKEWTGALVRLENSIRWLMWNQSMNDSAANLIAHRFGPSCLLWEMSSVAISEKRLIECWHGILLLSTVIALSLSKKKLARANGTDPNSRDNQQGTCSFEAGVCTRKLWCWSLLVPNSHWSPRKLVGELLNNLKEEKDLPLTFQSPISSDSWRYVRWYHGHKRGRAYL